MSALRGTKFTTFKVKLASCEAISIEAEASKAQAVGEDNCLCSTTKASNETSALGGAKSKAFYKAIVESGRAKPTSSEVKIRASGKACLALSRAKALASGKASLGSITKILAL